MTTTTTQPERLAITEATPSETPIVVTESVTADLAAAPEVELAGDAMVFDGKPLLKLPGDNSPLSAFARELGRFLRDQGVYERGGIAVTIDDGRITPVDFAVVPSWVEDYVVPFAIKEREGIRRRVIRSMSTATARLAFSAPQFLNALKPLNFLAPARMPIRRASGAIELLPLGYDLASGILTSPDSPDFQTDLTLHDAVGFLDELLAEFPFVEDGGRSKAVAIAAMLTVFGEGILDRNGQKPSFVYLANSEGSGKTLLAKLGGITAGIPTVTSAPTDEAEWKKTLLSFVIGGSRLLLLDNCKGHLESPALEGYLSSTQYGGRILGYSKDYHGVSGATVMITGNRLTVSSDIRRRSLFVELFTAELRPEDRKFNRILNQDELMRLRPTILSALYSMVRAWDEAGRPNGTIEHGTFHDWSNVIGGILENAGFANPCSKPEIDGMADTAPADLEQLAKRMRPGTRYEFGAIAKICVEEGLFEEAIAERDGYFLSRKGSSILGLTLKRFDRKIIGPSLRFVIQGKGHARRYCLVDASLHGQGGQHGPQALTATNPPEPLSGGLPPSLFPPREWSAHNQSFQAQQIQNSEPVAAPKAASARPRLTGAVGFNTLTQSVITQTTQNGTGTTPSPSNDGSTTKHPSTDGSTPNTPRNGTTRTSPPSLDGDSPSVTPEGGI